MAWTKIKNSKIDVGGNESTIKHFASGLHTAPVSMLFTVITCEGGEHNCSMIKLYAHLQYSNDSCGHFYDMQLESSVPGTSKIILLPIIKYTNDSNAQFLLSKDVPQGKCDSATHQFHTYGAYSGHSATTEKYLNFAKSTKQDKGLLSLISTGVTYYITLEQGMGYADNWAIRAKIGNNNDLSLEFTYSNPIKISTNVTQYHKEDFLICDDTGFMSTPSAIYENSYANDKGRVREKITVIANFEQHNCHIAIDQGKHNRYYIKYADPRTGFCNPIESARSDSCTKPLFNRPSIDNYYHETHNLNILFLFPFDNIDSKFNVMGRTSVYTGSAEVGLKAQINLRDTLVSCPLGSGSSVVFTNTAFFSLSSSKHFVNFPGRDKAHTNNCRNI